tara:strand:+ start:5396 stop:5884 length:489 start_codon:yes stop_codon:yes gene_type:complete
MKHKINVPRTIEWNNKPNRKYFLEHLIIDNGYMSMAEIGVRDGRTTFYLLDKIPYLKIYAVDTDIRLFYNETIKEKYSDRLIPINGDSAVVAERVPKVDLVFIDADHSYDGCRKDIQLYSKRINGGGCLSGHDIDFPGVNKAVSELVRTYDVGPNNVWFQFI